MADIDWGKIIGAGVQGATALGQLFNSQTANNSASGDYQKAYDEMLRNLQARFADYDALGKAGYQDVTAQEVGPSALGSIPDDVQARAAQMQSMGKLDEISAGGGLSLADMTALNDIQRDLNRNTSARRQGLANEYAARGQLGSGAQLAMDLAGQQQSAESANQRAESTAAQAQARALQAILQKGQVARGMGNDDYGRKAEAARARDAIEARNAAARMDASKTNNAYRGQAFQDELSKAAGKTRLTGDMNNAVFGKGQMSANNTLANANNTNTALKGLGSAFGSATSSGSTGSTSSSGVDTPTGGEDPYGGPLGPEYDPDKLDGE